jgi:phosphoribosylanthranilate isomerase
VYGGSGRTLRWSELSLPPGRRVLLAGGIGPQNVAEAVRTVRPFAIDVASGVEASPGVKDHLRMTQLFAAVAEANERREHA